MSEAGTRSVVVILALLLVQILFGFNYSIAKLIVAEFPPLLWGALRMLSCALLMFGVAFWAVPKEDRKMDSKFFYSILIFSIFGIALNQAFFLLGLKYTTASNSAILNTLVPVFTLFFAIVFKRERWTWMRGFGFLVAVSGVLVLRNVEDLNVSSETLRGDVYTVLNCVSLAFFFTASRRFLLKHSAFWVTAWLFLFGAVFLLVLSIPDWVLLKPIHWSNELIWAMLYNVVAATMVTYFLNTWTLKRTQSSSVALFIYLQPVIAVFTEWAVHSVIPTTRMILSMVFIFIGVGLGAIKRG